MDYDALLWLAFILALFVVPTCGFTIDAYVAGDVLKSCYEAQSKVSHDLKCGQKGKP